MNVDMALNPVLCSRKKEATGVNANIHQGATSLREIQCQENMESYKGTLSVMLATIMELFPTNYQINPKAINLAMVGIMLIQNGDVIKKTWIHLDTCSTDSVTKKIALC